MILTLREYLKQFNTKEEAAAKLNRHPEVIRGILNRCYYEDYIVFNDEIYCKMQRRK